jgi:predicted DCC family thiol-disulfide oxidoreductase YuxK
MRSNLPRAVLLFDGACVLCSGVARLVAKNDADGRFRLVPLAAPEAESLLAASGGPPRGDTVVPLDYGRRFERSDAVLYLALGLRAPFPLAFALIVIPRPLRDAVYRWVANNRSLLRDVLDP